MTSRSKPVLDQDRVFHSLEKVIHAFFEGHDVPPLQQSAFLVRVAKAVAPADPKKQRKPKPSRVVISSERDIQRMWAKHDRATGKKD